MPSPIGHALAGVAAGWAVGGPATRRRALVAQAAILAAVGAAPDLDLLVGRHRAEAHSLGAALIVGAVAAWLRWPVARSRVRIFVAVALAYAMHPALDMLGVDGAPPVGVMAFWPVSHQYFMTAAHLFAPISRRWWLSGFFTHNLLAVVREVAMLAPVAALIWWLRARRGRVAGQ